MNKCLTCGAQYEGNRCPVCGAAPAVPVYAAPVYGQAAGNAPAQPAAPAAPAQPSVSVHTVLKNAFSSGIFLAMAVARMIMPLGMGAVGALSLPAAMLLPAAAALLCALCSHMANRKKSA